MSLSGDINRLRKETKGKNVPKSGPSSSLNMRRGDRDGGSFIKIGKTKKAPLKTRSCVKIIDPTSDGDLPLVDYPSDTDDENTVFGCLLNEPNNVGDLCQVELGGKSALRIKSKVGSPISVGQKLFPYIGSNVSDLGTVGVSDISDVLDVAVTRSLEKETATTKLVRGFFLNSLTKAIPPTPPTPIEIELICSVLQPGLYGEPQYSPITEYESDRACTVCAGGLKRQTVPPDPAYQWQMGAPAVFGTLDLYVQKFTEDISGINPRQPSTEYSIGDKVFADGTQDGGPAHQDGYWTATDIIAGYTGSMEPTWSDPSPISDGYLKWTKGTDLSWQASTSYGLGDQVLPVAGSAGLIYTCTRAGTSGGTEPTWPTNPGETVDDPDGDGVEWTAVSPPRTWSPDDLVPLPGTDEWIIPTGVTQRLTPELDSEVGLTSSDPAPDWSTSPLEDGMIEWTYQGDIIDSALLAHISGGFFYVDAGLTTGIIEGKNQFRFAAYGNGGVDSGGVTIAEEVT